MPGSDPLTATSEEPAAPPDVPFAFGLALWIPTFAVILWAMLKILQPRSVPADPHPGAPSPDKDGSGVDNPAPGDKRR